MADRVSPTIRQRAPQTPATGDDKVGLLGSAKIYALPELLFSLYKFIPFYQPTSGSKQDRKRK